MKLCFRPDLASSCALEKSAYVVVHHKCHLIELLAWFCERRLMQPSGLNTFIFAFNTVNFGCLPICFSIFQKQLWSPCPISINFTEQSYHHYEVLENFTKTAGWIEEQDPICALCRKLMKWLYMYSTNSHDKRDVMNITDAEKALIRACNL